MAQNERPYPLNFIESLKAHWKPSLAIFCIGFVLSCLVGSWVGKNLTEKTVVELVNKGTQEIIKKM